MPKDLEKELRKRAKKKGLNKKRTDAYVYGALRKMGWKPKTSSLASEVKNRAK